MDNWHAGMMTRIATCIAVLAGAALAAGCATTHPPPLGERELAAAESFPFFRLYWVGPRFDGSPLVAADGQKGYLPSVGDSVYYGDCVHSKGVFGGGSCSLPLQVTTVIYRLHVNSALGAQRNTVIRGVPATIYDEGHSIELYSGREAIDIFSDSFAHAYQAALELRPLNAPATASGNLPPPVFCPGLSGPQDEHVQRVMAHLPHHVCQRAAVWEAFVKSLQS
jgi:hypothetical protein